VELFAQHPTLQKVLVNPAVPVQRKRATMAELVERTKLSPMVGKLLLLLAERDRLVLLPDLLAAYRDRLLDHLKIVRAEVTTAVPLAADRVGAVERALAHVTGREVVLETRVNTAIVGGLVARVGSTVYDASIATQLEKIKKTLTEGA
jgi:F-type H+-transporting ATPase subunit delta